MTPKEKAQELVNKYYRFTNTVQYPDSNYKDAKKCALIAVDEIKKAVTWTTEEMYWHEVKQEIEKL